MTMKHRLLLIPLGLSLMTLSCTDTSKNKVDSRFKYVGVSEVKIDDSFWSPKFNQWSTVTVNDVLNKFEGKFVSNPMEQEKNNTFVNFDDVASGKKGTGHHAGLPWFDGLIYETIRGVSDLLAQTPNKEIEQRLDGYIDRIYAAQKADTDGYLNTYTDLIEPNHRWGDNGGFLRFQHDVYNAGMLIEAGVHYYQATGKTKLLEVAVRFANHMTDIMGPAPKRNIVPSHAGPEEPMIKLYWLFKDNAELKSRINVPINETAYWDLATFWIENRGNHSGFPLWLTWGNEKAEQWIKDEKYKEPKFGEGARPTWGDYAQDSISVFEQKTIEGHAVRATLLATGIATAALENKSVQYIESAENLWENMVGKRMFVTGGVGAIHHDEKFGPDYFLPTDAYLETCAAVGAGFFSQRMNELTEDAKYMDEFERALYNNVLTGISLSGTEYTYQNPLNSHDHSRWEWHSCPCCPPMFLKIISALPGYIYASKGNEIYVNLFIGSTTEVDLENTSVRVSQKTEYPWGDKVGVTLDPKSEGEFALNIRIPGWAQGKENPYDLYSSNLTSNLSLTVNGKAEALNIKNGYASITRKWEKGDYIELGLPMQPRVIKANEQVADLRGMMTFASGPLIYCLEGVDNTNLDKLFFDENSPLELVFDKNMLGGVNVIKGTAKHNLVDIPIVAIPYYAAGNRMKGSYKVWLPQLQ